MLPSDPSQPYYNKKYGWRVPSFCETCPNYTPPPIVEKEHIVSTVSKVKLPAPVYKYSKKVYNDYTL
jgi:hypothetical protein